MCNCTSGNGDVTVRGHHHTTLNCGTVSAISCTAGAAQGAPRRRLTSTSIQNVSQPRVGPMPSIVAGPWMLDQMVGYTADLYRSIPDLVKQ